MTKDPKGFREFAFGRELLAIHRDDIIMIRSNGASTDVWLKNVPGIVRLVGVKYEDMKKWWRGEN